jgi:transcription elongation factor GreA
VARHLCRQWEDVPAPEIPETPPSLPAPDELARAVPDTEVLMCVLDTIKARSPQVWEQLCAGLMPLVDRNECGVVARRLRNAEAGEALAEARREILLRDDGHPGALAWLWRDLTAPGTETNEGDVAGAPVLMCILSRLAALVRARGLGEEERREHIAELRTSIFVRDGMPLREALESAENHQLAAIKALGERNPALTDRMQADLVNALQAVAPELFERRIDPWEEDVIYSTEAGVEKRRSELEEIVNVRLPEVIREIGAAAGFGDISDNAEYQSAVMERARLAERAGRMQEEITEARLITEELASAEHVSIGSRVTARNAITGETEVMAFLGPWDAKPDERIYAYNAPLGLAFMGRSVGDEVVYTVGPDERRWEILQIESGV